MQHGNGKREIKEHRCHTREQLCKQDGGDQFAGLAQLRLAHRAPRGQADLAAVGRVLGRVVQQVAERLRSGEWRWFLIAGMALKDKAGSPFRLAGSVIDVTERKQAEQILQEANRTKDEFLATLAHELRNPLAPISAAAELMEKSPLDAEGMRRTSAIISLG